MDSPEEPGSSAKEPLNIVILGASFAGLAVAHKFLRQIIEDLSVTRSAPRYRVYLIGPSRCLYWNIGAPRALVDGKHLPLDEVFVPFLDLFEDYLPTRFQYIQGYAREVDFNSRNVFIEPVSDSAEFKRKPNPRWSQITTATAATDKSAGVNPNWTSIPFHALVVATGTSAESPLLSLHGPHENTIKSLRAFHERVASASSIVVAGGGCSGIEITGQLATWLNRGKKASSSSNRAATTAEKNAFWKWLLPKKSTPTAPVEGTEGEPLPFAPVAPARRTIILVSGHDRLLPRLRPEFGAQAEKQLKSIGIHVMHNVRVEQAVEMPSGNTRCVLSGGLELSCDAFVGATGVYPNTKFMPPHLLDASGYVNTDPQYLRVLGAGDRVYALGDCASHSKNSIQDVYDSIPILLQNLKNDLLTYEFTSEHPYGGAESRTDKLVDYEFVQSPTDSQLMPIKRFGGVGILFGMKLPSTAVWMMKGRDYRIGRAKLAAGVGKDPYAVV